MCTDLRSQIFILLGLHRKYFENKRKQKKRTYEAGEKTAYNAISYITIDRCLFKKRSIQYLGVLFISIFPLIPNNH